MPSPSDDADVPQLSQEELNAFVDEAPRMMHDKGLFLVPAPHGSGCGKRNSRRWYRPRRTTRRTAGRDAEARYYAGCEDWAGKGHRSVPAWQNAVEFAYIAADGMTPEQSLLAGTSVAAELGLAGRTGALKAGMLADIVGMPGNPWRDIRQRRASFSR